MAHFELITNLIYLVLMVVSLFFLIRFIEFLDRYDEILFMGRLVCKKCRKRINFMRLCIHINLDEKNTSLTPIIPAVLIAIILITFTQPTEAEVNQAIYEVDFKSCVELSQHISNLGHGYHQAKTVFIIKQCDPANNIYLDSYLPFGYNANDIMKNPPNQTAEWNESKHTIIKVVRDLLSN